MCNIRDAEKNGEDSTIHKVLLSNHLLSEYLDDMHNHCDIMDKNAIIGTSDYDRKEIRLFRKGHSHGDLDVRVTMEITIETMKPKESSNGK